MKIYLSNNTYKDMPKSTPEQVEAVLDWFRDSGPDSLLHLAFETGGQSYIQRRHIVQIEV